MRSGVKVSVISERRNSGGEARGSGPAPESPLLEKVPPPDIQEHGSNFGMFSVKRAGGHTEVWDSRSLEEERDKASNENMVPTATTVEDNEQETDFSFEMGWDSFDTLSSLFSSMRHYCLELLDPQQQQQQQSEGNGSVGVNDNSKSLEKLGRMARMIEDVKEKQARLANTIHKKSGLDTEYKTVNALYNEKIKEIEEKERRKIEDAKKTRDDETLRIKAEMEAKLANAEREYNTRLSKIKSYYSDIRCQEEKMYMNESNKLSESIDECDAWVEGLSKEVDTLKQRFAQKSYKFFGNCMYHKYERVATQQQHPESTTTAAENDGSSVSNGVEGDAQLVEEGEIQQQQQQQYQGNPEPRQDSSDNSTTLNQESVHRADDSDSAMAESGAQNRPSSPPPLTFVQPLVSENGHKTPSSGEDDEMVKDLALQLEADMEAQGEEDEKKDHSNTTPQPCHSTTTTPTTKGKEANNGMGKMKKKNEDEKKKKKEGGDRSSSSSKRCNSQQQTNGGDRKKTKRTRSESKPPRPSVEEAAVEENKESHPPEITNNNNSSSSSHENTSSSITYRSEDGKFVYRFILDEKSRVSTGFVVEYNDGDEWGKNQQPAVKKSTVIKFADIQTNQGDDLVVCTDKNRFYGKSFLGYYTGAILDNCALDCFKPILNAKFPIPTEACNCICYIKSGGGDGSTATAAADVPNGHHPRAVCMMGERHTSGFFTSSRVANAYEDLIRNGNDKSFSLFKTFRNAIFDQVKSYGGDGLKNLYILCFMDAIVTSSSNITSDSGAKPSVRCRICRVLIDQQQQKKKNNKRKKNQADDSPADSPSPKKPSRKSSKPKDVETATPAAMSNLCKNCLKSFKGDSPDDGKDEFYAIRNSFCFTHNDISLPLRVFKLHEEDIRLLFPYIFKAATAIKYYIDFYSLRIKKNDKPVHLKESHLLNYIKNNSTAITDAYTDVSSRYYSTQKKYRMMSVFHNSVRRSGNDLSTMAVAVPTPPLENVPPTTTTTTPSAPVTSLQSARQSARTVGRKRKPTSTISEMRAKRKKKRPEEEAKMYNNNNNKPVKGKPRDKTRISTPVPVPAPTLPPQQPHKGDDSSSEGKSRNDGDTNQQSKKDLMDEMASLLERVKNIKETDPSSEEKRKALIKILAEKRALYQKMTLSQMDDSSSSSSSSSSEDDSEEEEEEEDEDEH